MIIECQACQARFRLDESKIKGKGARIRCRKCGESIIVMKSDVPPPKMSPPVGKEFFDLRAILQEPEKRPPLPPREEVDTAFEFIKNRERETEQAYPPAPEEPPEPFLPRDEGDAAFESPLFREEEKQEALTAEPPEPFLPRDEGDAAFESPLFREEEKQEALTAEPPEPFLPRDEGDAAFESMLGGERETEQVPTPVVEEPAPPEEETQEALTAEPPEPFLPRDEGDAAFESPLFREEEKQEALTAEPPEPFLPRDEVDAAFESILGKKRETEQEPPPVEEEWALPQEVQDLSFPLELGKEGDISSPQETGETPVRSPEDWAGEEVHPLPPLTEKGWDHPGQQPTEFLGLDTTLPDFLRKGEAAKEPSKQFDISEQLSDVPIGVPGEDVAPVSPAPDSPPDNMDSAAARAETIQDQLSDLVDSKSTKETPIPDSPPPEMPSPQPMEIERKPAIRPRLSVPSGKPSVALVALLFVILAGGGAYFAFTGTGQKSLRTLIPGMESLWLGGKESVKPYSIGNLIGYYETGDKAGRMFVIKGVATNQGRKEKSGIRIRAELLDGNHQTIAEKTVYAGNIIKGLRSTEQEKIETAMSNRFGDRLSNVDVAPGKSVPFMLVFFDPPEGIEEYRLEALDGD